MCRRFASRMRYSSISVLHLWIASVTLSGAGPPAGMLYLIPKSPSAPAGLWLAERISPPSVLRLRITAEAAGVERIPFWPTRTRAAPPAAAIFRMTWIASLLK